MIILEANLLGETTEVVQLQDNKRYVIEVGEKKYFLTKNGIEEINVNLEKIQTSFFDNIVT